MVKNLNPRTIEHRLREQRDTLIKRVQVESENLGKLIDLNADPGDRALQETTKMRRLALIAQARLQVEQIETCLQRLQQNMYGICVECGNPINPERLMAIPYATLCIKCQTKQDKTRRN